ncbi:MAG TPA: type IV pilus secretin PilQ [Candidatus Angelobacter sp.]|nr:type IV pilus secretin PilQ [Candidatus Angelobacter sp.]
MRHKQLGIILLGMAATLAAGSDSQLSGIRVEERDAASLVTIRATGTFTHTEYRPSANLMLVDLAGVSVSPQDSALHAVSTPGIESYRISEYRSVSGGEVARVELALAGGADVKVKETEGGLELQVRAASAKAVVPASVVDAALPRASQLSRITNVAVARGKEGLDIEITGSAPMTAKTMRLTAPQRVVLDIPNSVLDGRSREIQVNSGDVKEVRVARYQNTPPTTRLVVDMAGARDFEVVPSANHLILRLKDASSAPASQPGSSLSGAKEAIAAVPAVTSGDNIPAKMNAGAAPSTPVSTAQSAAGTHIQALQAQAEENGGHSRSDRAASHFEKSVTVPYSSNMPVASASIAAKPEAVNAALQQQQQQGAPAPAQASATVQRITNCTSGPFTGEIIGGMNLKDADLKDFFRLIHELSGLNVILDPSVSGSLTIDVEDIPWDQALAVVLRNNGLECELQGNVLRIAKLDTLRAEADARRAQQDAIALAVPKETHTYYLSYGQAKDIVPTIKKFLTQRGDAVPDTRSNSIIVEDIPSSFPKLEAILRGLDSKTKQVQIEARVVAATRSFIRDIGTQIAFGFGNAVTAVGGNPNLGSSPISVTTPPGAPTPTFITTQGGTGQQIPLFTNLPAASPTSGLSFLNFTNRYRLDLVLSAAESRGLLKVLSRPSITTQNNTKAVMKQGKRVPVVTGAVLGGPPTVQYIEALLRLTVTPQITSENTIFLDVDIENTTVDLTTISGQQINPTLNTQQATTQVLVSDGQTLVIGGAIQTTNNLAYNEVPFLGSLPVLGNLFKHKLVNTSTQELIFFITPKIVVS